MALDINTLVTEIRKISDKDFQDFEGFPDDIVAASERWASAIETYATNIIPISTTISVAKEAMKSLLLTATAPGSALTVLPQSIAAFTNAVAPGMAPAFTAVPPVGQPILEPVYAIGNAGGSASEVANAFASVVDAFFRTGLATPSGGGTPINWS